jgi:glycosyltransferase involved in cell wall biosynthesis
MASRAMTDANPTKQLHIVYVWDADYPWDVRAEKSCLALTEAGHDVHIVARNRKRSPVIEKLPEATVHRMPPWRWAGRKMDAALGFPAFFNPRWRSLIANTARAVHADVIIARDLPLCPTAISVGRKLRIPVVLDMAENYPAMMRDIWRAHRQRAVDYLVRNPWMTELVEKYCISHSDHVITVVEASSARLRKLGVPDHKLTVISNTPPVERTLGRPHAVTPQEHALIKVVYLGLLEVPRGLNELIDAIKQLHDAGHVEFQALIIGAGRDEQLFHERAKRKELSPDAIKFFGRLPHDDALAIVGTGDIGVIPHHATDSWNTTIPNKLFDYMAVGIPVVSSDTRPCGVVLNETGAGRTFRAGDAADLASALLGFSAPEVRASVGRAGVAAVRSGYNWEADSMRLNAVVERMVNQGSKPA